jgi:hypothetical protein
VQNYAFFPKCLFDSLNCNNQIYMGSTLWVF